MSPTRAKAKFSHLRKLNKGIDFLVRGKVLKLGIPNIFSDKCGFVNPLGCQTKECR